MSKELIILIERYSYTIQTTLGKMYFLYHDNFVSFPLEQKKEFFGNTLDDTARPDNIKVYEETCIPVCECLVSLYESTHHGKTIVFHTEEDKRTLKLGPLTWTSCLAHGGNTHKDTAGCVIIAKNIINKDIIQGSLKDELRKFIEKKIDEGYTIKARFVNLTQLN